MQEISEVEGEKFARSCAAAGEYPVNLVYHNTYDHILKGYSGRLDEQEDRLFFDESEANLCLRDYDDGVKCWFCPLRPRNRDCPVEIASNPLE